MRIRSTFAGILLSLTAVVGMATVAGSTTYPPSTTTSTVHRTTTTTTIHRTTTTTTVRRTTTTTTTRSSTTTSRPATTTTVHRTTTTTTPRGTTTTIHRTTTTTTTPYVTTTTQPATTTTQGGGTSSLPTSTSIPGGSTSTTSLTPTTSGGAGGTYYPGSKFILFHGGFQPGAQISLTVKGGGTTHRIVLIANNAGNVSLTAYWNNNQLTTTSGQVLSVGPGVVHFLFSGTSSKGCACVLRDTVKLRLASLCVTPKDRWYMDPLLFVAGFLCGALLIFIFCRRRGHIDEIDDDLVWRVHEPVRLRKVFRATGLQLETHDVETLSGYFLQAKATQGSVIDLVDENAVRWIIQAEVLEDRTITKMIVRKVVG